jgi:hypothetical protein
MRTRKREGASTAERHSINWIPYNGTCKRSILKRRHLIDAPTSYREFQSQMKRATGTISTSKSAARPLNQSESFRDTKLANMDMERGDIPAQNAQLVAWMVNRTLVGLTKPCSKHTMRT